MTNKSRRSFLKTAGIAGVGGTALSMLAGINGGVAAKGEAIPIGGGMPLTGWAAADGIEFKNAMVNFFIKFFFNIIR